MTTKTGEALRLAEAGPSSIAFADQVADWFTVVAANELCANDQKKYRREIERAAADQGWTCASDANFRSVSAYLAKRRLSSVRKNPDGSPRRNSGKTYNNLLTMLRSFFSYAVKCGWCDEDPSGKIAWVDEQDSGDGSRPFTPAQVRAVLNYVRTPTTDGRRTADRYYPYLVAATTMLRPSTLKQLTAGMLEVEWGEDGPKGSLRLLRHTVKKAGATRVMPIPDETTRELLAWIAAKRLKPNDLLFEHLSENDQLIADAHACGIPRYTAEGGIGWNSFRKCYAGEMSEKVTPTVLNALSGHRDIRTTMKHYIRKGAEGARSDINNLLPPSRIPVDKSPRGLTDPGEVAEYVHAEPDSLNMNANLPHPDSETPRPSAFMAEQVQRFASPPAEGGASQDLERPAAEVTPRGFEPLGRVSGSAGRSSDAADLLEALAKFLRSGVMVLGLAACAAVPSHDTKQPRQQVSLHWEWSPARGDYALVRGER